MLLFPAQFSLPLSSLADGGGTKQLSKFLDGIFHVHRTITPTHFQQMFGGSANLCPALPLLQYLVAGELTQALHKFVNGIAILREIATRIFLVCELARFFLQLG